MLYKLFNNDNNLNQFYLGTYIGYCINNQFLYVDIAQKMLSSLKMYFYMLSNNSYNNIIIVVIIANLHYEFVVGQSQC